MGTIAKYEDLSKYAEDPSKLLPDQRQNPCIVLDDILERFLQFL